MPADLNRRLFMKRSSTGLAGVTITAGASVRFHSAAVNGTSSLELLGGTPVRSNP